jgi:hypothetical protein
MVAAAQIADRHEGIKKCFHAIKLVINTLLNADNYRQCGRRGCENDTAAGALEISKVRAGGWICSCVLGAALV